MNTLKKVALVAVAMTAVAGPATASPSLVAALPDLTALTSEVGRWIADEWEGLRKVLLSVPRVTSTEREATVTIFEGSNHMIVEASRLPADAELVEASRVATR